MFWVPSVLPQNERRPPAVYPGKIMEALSGDLSDRNDAECQTAGYLGDRESLVRSKPEAQDCEQGRDEGHQVSQTFRSNRRPSKLLLRQAWS